MNLNNLTQIKDASTDISHTSKIKHYVLLEINETRWNKMALIANRKMFIKINGYEPMNDAEVTRWARNTVK